MAKQKHYYLIKNWNVQRGTTEEDPAYYLGTGSYIAETLHDVKSFFCYTSPAHAQRVVDKYNDSGWRWGYKYKLIEIPVTALRKEA